MPPSPGLGLSDENSRSTTPIVARQVETIDEAQLPMSRYTRLANYIDLCAVSVPFGEVGGAPAGMQLVANNGQDFTVLSLAISFAGDRD